jgi:uncharacterized protein (TIGR00255 family)
MRSMTGFGKAHAPLRQGTIDAEIRSVNHRYFKFMAVVPDELTPYESELEELVRKAVRRGAVQLTIKLEASRTPPDAPTLNLKALRSYVRQIRAAQKTLKLSGEIPVSLLATLPQVWSAEGAGEDRGPALWAAARKAATRAVEELAAARDREGRGIRTACLGYLDAMERSLREVRDRAPTVVKEHQARLRERIAALLADTGARLQEQDLLRETAVFADKCDIAEELQRLGAHLAEFRRQVDTGSEIGRRLDFLGQEILREANTIGVKSNDYAISAAMVNLKAELEKVKEQLENVE